MRIRPVIGLPSIHYVLAQRTRAGAGGAPRCMLFHGVRVLHPELLLESPVIEVQHITKRYGRVTAVDDVSFTVERGEILGFLGPNGAGKTTTMRILTGYMPATEGRAIVAGFDVFDQPIEAKKRTGYLPETPPLYPEMG